MCEKQDTKLQEATSKVDYISSNLQSCITNSIEDCLSAKFARYEQITNDFNNYFKKGLLSSILEDKVDHRQLTQVAETKMSKEEYGTMVSTY